MEVLRGLNYFSIINNRKEDEKDYSQILKIFWNTYPETLRYLIIENIWILNYYNIHDIFQMKLYNENDANIIKYIILNYDMKEYLIHTLFGNLFYDNFNAKLLDEFNELLKSIGKELYNIEKLEGWHTFITINHRSDNLEAYKWIINKLKYTKNKEFYLREYMNLDNENEELKNYILSKLPKTLNRDEVNGTLMHLLSNNDYKKFKLFYRKYKFLLNNDDKNNLKQNMGNRKNYLKLIDE